MASARYFFVCLVVTILALFGAMALIHRWFPAPSPRIDSPRGSAGVGAPSFLRRPGGGGRLPTLPRPRENYVRIFFTNDGLKLQPQVIDLPRSLRAEDRLRFVLKELVRGPATDFFRSTLPAGTELRGAYLLGDTAVVDLTGDMLTFPLGGPMTELLCVYAIVDTVLENLGEAHAVRILIDGRSARTLWDQVDLSGPLTADVSLIEY